MKWEIYNVGTTTVSQHNVSVLTTQHNYLNKKERSYVIAHASSSMNCIKFTCI